MRLLPIESVQPGVYLAKTIYDSLGRVLLAKGTCLTLKYLQRLTDLEFRSIYIEDEISESIQIEDVIPDETRAQVSRITQETLISAKKGERIIERVIKQSVNDIIDELLNNRDAIVHLTEIRSLKDYTFTHSVNVCVLSVLTGISLGYNQLKLKELGMGALLHDIGKAKLPDEMYNEGELEENERNLYQRHCQYGWEVLKDAENVRILPAHVALQHHEQFDGQGYPRGVSGKTISEFARIVAVANFYDNLASDHPTRKRMFPHEVIALIKSKQGSYFDPDIVSAFVPNIAPFPAGSIVVLNNGFKAIVVSVQKQNPTAPQIRLICDEKGNKLEVIQYVDLMAHPTLVITEVMEE